MATFDPIDRDRAILWARNVLKNKDKYLIMDTETTGLKNDDEIIQMAIVDLDRNIHFDTLIKPKLKKSISREATQVHGIKKNDLIDAPCFESAVHKFIKVTEGKTLLMFNADFDVRLLQQTCYANRCKTFDLSYWCAMKEYSKFIGEWNDYFNDYRYQKLKGGDHTALGDCLATLKVIEQMAQAEVKHQDLIKKEEELAAEKEKQAAKKEEIRRNKKWWQFWK